MKKLFLALALCISTAAFAGYTTAGTISRVHYLSNNTILFTISGSHTHYSSDQACVTQQPKNFAVDGSTASGRTQVAGLIAAYSTSKPVVVYGKGLCTVHPQRETLDYFYTAD